MNLALAFKRRRPFGLRGSLLGLSALLVGTLFSSACTTTDPKEHFVASDNGNASGGKTGSGGATNGPGGAGPGTGGAASGDGGGIGVGSGGKTATGGAASGGSTNGIECGAPPVKEGTFSRAALRSAAAECSLWNFCEFEATAAALEASVAAYAEDRSAKKLAAARDRFREAMLVWSRLEAFQFGPLAETTMDVYQGQDLRAAIYYWPKAARCRVEEQLVSQKYLQSGVGSVLVTARGLTALEYLLFYEESDTACLAVTAAAKAWAQLPAEEIESRKVSYAVALAADLRAQAENLSRAFGEAGKAYHDKFVNVAAHPSVYPNEQEAMNVLAWALIYVEREVKDWKLGVPAGYTQNALVTQETPYAQLATESLRANLRGFRALFVGCGENGEGIGFDDWLRAVGQEQLADDMIDAYENAQSVFDALPPFHQATPAQIEEAYRAIKGLTDLLKADFFGAGSALNLKLPATLEGDND